MKTLNFVLLRKNLKNYIYSYLNKQDMIKIYLLCSKDFKDQNYNNYFCQIFYFLNKFKKINKFPSSTNKYCNFLDEISIIDLAFCKFTDYPVEDIINAIVYYLEYGYEESGKNEFYIDFNNVNNVQHTSAIIQRLNREDFHYTLENFYTITSEELNSTIMKYIKYVDLKGSANTIEYDELLTILIKEKLDIYFTGIISYGYKMLEEYMLLFENNFSHICINGDTDKIYTLCERNSNSIRSILIMNLIYDNEDVVKLLIKVLPCLINLENIKLQCDLGNEFMQVFTELNKLVSLDIRDTGIRLHDNMAMLKFKHLKKFTSPVITIFDTNYYMNIGIFINNHNNTLEYLNLQFDDLNSMEFIMNNLDIPQLKELEIKISSKINSHKHYSIFNKFRKLCKFTYRTYTFNNTFKINGIYSYMAFGERHFDLDFIVMLIQNNKEINEYEYTFETNNFTWLYSIINGLQIYQKCIKIKNICYLHELTQVEMEDKLEIKILDSMYLRNLYNFCLFRNIENIKHVRIYRVDCGLSVLKNKGINVIVIDKDDTNLIFLKYILDNSDCFRELYAVKVIDNIYSSKFFTNKLIKSYNNNNTDLCYLGLKLKIQNGCDEQKLNFLNNVKGLKLIDNK